MMTTNQFDFVDRFLQLQIWTKRTIIDFVSKFIFFNLMIWLNFFLTFTVVQFFFSTQTYFI